MSGRFEIPESETEMRVFHNRLRILMGIDKRELIEAGVIGELFDDGMAIKNADHDWRAFSSNPYGWFVRASDDQCKKLWSIILEREA